MIFGQFFGPESSTYNLLRLTPTFELSIAASDRPAPMVAIPLIAPNCPLMDASVDDGMRKGAGPPKST